MKILFRLLSLIFYLLGDLSFKIHFWWGYMNLMKISVKLDDKYGTQVWRDVEDMN